MSELKEGITKQDTKLHTNNALSRYLFFYEGEEDGWTFEVEAKDHIEAFNKAYEMWGPQVENMFYRLIY